jgi:arabinosaccharide transport system substrate-binding protein
MYRSDLVEAAGIDVSKIETWDDYFRLLRPLMVDLDGDGRTDRFLLNSSASSLLFNEVLMLQGGGGFFDVNGHPIMNCDANVRVLSRITTWYVGPRQVANEVNLWTASGLRLINEGYVIGLLAPDWLLGSLAANLPGLAGKVKIMPVPAFEKGGRRTAVLGGTMLGITRNSPHREDAWEFAKQVYLSAATAKRLFDLARIVTPIKSNWHESFYDEPDPYYSNQPVGRILLNLAPDVPRRSSSPFYTQAQQVLNVATIELARYASEHGINEPAALEPEARRILDRAQQQLLLQINHNIFLRHP